MIPPFDPESGSLPPGVHRATWAELVQRFGYTTHRYVLLVGLRAGLDELARAGCRRVWVDGSFVTIKKIPNDFDACWDSQGVDLGQLDPVLLDLSNGRAAQHARYGGALMQADFVFAGADGETVLDGQQRDYRTGHPKGIVQLDLRAGLESVTD